MGDPQGPVTVTVGDWAAQCEQATAIRMAVFVREQQLPEADEISASVEFVSQPKDDSTKLSVWEQLAQVLLSSNELMYVD